MVLVHKNQYYCECGLIQDPSEEEQQLIKKRQEKTGPRIGKGKKDSLNNFIFESIRFTDQERGLIRPKELMPDPEPREKERLEADNCTVTEE